MRQKKTVITGVTRDEMEDAFGRYATADAEVVRINATMDKQFVEIREANADKLAELEQEKKDAFEIMQAFATVNKDELFAKRRSLESTHGTLGFRTGTPKLKPKKGFTWSAVLEMVKSFMPGYVRTVEEVAKDKMLADRDEEGVAEKMEKCGVLVVQDETFFVEPKKEGGESL